MAIATDQLERLNTGTAEDVLSWGLEEFHPRMAISAAFLPEDMVVIDLAHRINPDVRVFTLDTGRLPQETYDLIDQVRGRYDMNIQVMFPDAADVEAMTRKNGLNLFYKEKSLRLLCCHIRKVIPLERARGRTSRARTSSRSRLITRTATSSSSTRSATGPRIRFGITSDRTTCRTRRCTTRATPRSGARPARDRSSRVRTIALGAGGGSRRRTRSAASITSRPRSTSKRSSRG